MKKKSFEVIKFLIGWPLSLIAVYIIFTTFSNQFDNTKINFLNLNTTYLLIGFSCFICYFALRSLVWFQTLQFRKYEIGYIESSSLWMSSQLKRYIPGNFWSFLGLGIVFSEKNVKKQHITNSIIIDEQLVLLTTPLISLLSWGFITKNYFPTIAKSPYLLELLIVSLISINIIYIFISKIFLVLPNLITKYLNHFVPNFTPIQNLRLISIMSLAFTSLSLGYFFTISSIVNLPLNNFLPLIGLFIFSVLVGYISFIFPTGLGIREGVITLGLSSFLPLGIAGFLSLFARGVLIIAELTTIGIFYFLYKSKNLYIKKLLHLISQKKQILLVYLGSIIYSIYFSYTSILRYDNFYTGRFDLGNMAQTVWNTANGRIFQLTNPNGTEIVSRLAFHSDYFLILLSPFYILWQDPRVLLIIQAVIVSIGAIFTYYLANKILNNKNIATIIAFAYLFNPALERSNIYDFHSVVPATTFILATFYFMLEKRYKLFILFCLLAASTKEQIWFLIGLFGLYISYFQKKYLLGITIALISFILFYLHLWVIIPNAAGDMHFAISYYSEDSTSPTDIIKNILFSPNESLTTLTTTPKLSYYMQLLGPLGFLPLLSPLYLIFAGPDLIINLFSKKWELYSIYYQYTAVITPFLFISSIYGIKNLQNIFPKISFSHISIYIIIVTIYSSYIYGPLPGARDANLAMYTEPQINKDIIMQELNKIPSTKKVSSTNNIGSQLAHREHLYTVPIGIDKSDYVVFLMRSNSAQIEKEALIDIKSNKKFLQIFNDKSFYIFKRIQN